MTDVNPSTPPSTPPAGTPPVSRPDWLPESHWDTTANTIKPEFGAHYSELAAFQKTETERRAALPQRPEDYKIEIALPADVKAPEGLEMKVDSKDPRVPILQGIAHQFGLPQEAVTALATLDARMKIEAHNAAELRAGEEIKKLGDKAQDRIAAVENWGKGLVTKGEITSEEYEELRVVGSTAAGVSVLEKIMSKVNGAVPGHQPEPQQQSQPKTWAERMWPTGFNPNPQQKAS